MHEGVPVTDKPGRDEIIGRGVITLVGHGPATAADRVDAATLLELRAYLLAAPAVRARLLALQAVDPSALQAGASALSKDLDGHLSCVEIERAVPRAAGLLSPGLVASTGTVRTRARAPSSETVRIVAESLALRAEGASAAKADETIAESCYRWRADVACYRKRLREVAARLRPE